MSKFDLYHLVLKELRAVEVMKWKQSKRF
jgi:hypothetical protein